MEKFTSSFGSEVYMEGGVLYIGNPPLSPLTRAGVQALREFFQYERDQELGRWRCNGHLVAYARAEYPSYSHKGHSVMILDERDGRLIERWERDNTPDEWTDAAQAYFAAHPVSKPWHDAKPGEVWAITYEGVEQAWGAGFKPLNTGEFVFACGESRISVNDQEITAGRRIWPEVE